MILVTRSLVLPAYLACPKTASPAVVMVDVSDALPEIVLGIVLEIFRASSSETLKDRPWFARFTDPHDSGVFKLIH